MDWLTPEGKDRTVVSDQGRKRAGWLGPPIASRQPAVAASRLNCDSLFVAGIQKEQSATC